MVGGVIPALPHGTGLVPSHGAVVDLSVRGSCGLC